MSNLSSVLWKRVLHQGFKPRNLSELVLVNGVLCLFESIIGTRLKVASWSGVRYGTFESAVDPGLECVAGGPRDISGSEKLRKSQVL